MTILFGQVPDTTSYSVNAFGFGDWLVDEGYSGIGFGCEDDE